MQNPYYDLIQQLRAPIVEYNDKGESVHRPPTSIMLRASRVITKLVQENIGLINSINNVNVFSDLQQAQSLNEISGDGPTRGEDGTDQSTQGSDPASQSS